MNGDKAKEIPSEGRRAFFRTLGRGLVLGATGAGVAAMVRNGRLDLTKCIDEHGPCKTCIAVNGCALPKAEDFKRNHPHG